MRTSSYFTFGKPMQRIFNTAFGFIFLLSLHANAQQPLGFQLGKKELEAKK